MSDRYVQKDGWHVVFKGGVLAWEEINPSYTTMCRICNGMGEVHPNRCHECDDGYHNVGFGCLNRVRCTHCRDGYTKDPPATPMPDTAYLDEIEVRLRKVMKQYGEEVDSGVAEERIKKNKALDQSMKSSSL